MNTTAGGACAGDVVDGQMDWEESGRLQIVGRKAKEKKKHHIEVFLYISCTNVIRYEKNI